MKKKSTKKKSSPTRSARRKHMQLTERHREYWHRNVNLTLILLAIWFVVTFVVGYFARELSGITILGFPFAFYMGAQGALIIYVVIIFYYAARMNRMDKEYDVDEKGE
jgi:putative solute:sodium symporter small subunit